jgi:hypothetical protein
MAKKEVDTVETLIKIQKKLQRSFERMAAKVERLHNDPQAPLEAVFNATVLMNQTAEKVFYTQERIETLQKERGGEKSALRLAGGEEDESVPFGFAAYTHAQKKKEAQKAAAA